ncbi:uncharacterized protein LOC144574108 isoform X2 [Carex rostrata]
MDDKGVVQGEESCSYLDMLKCGMGEGTEEEILGFSSRFLGFGGFYEPVGLPMMYHGVSGTGNSNSTSTTVQQMSSESSSMSSLSSSPTSTAATNSMMSNSSSSRQQKKKQENGGRKTGATNGGHNKKAKTGGGVSHSQGGTIKVRKEKLGERIMALQQLVSPFGKSDTASVLHEALGYIRFLHDQVQVLSSPYLQRLPSSTTLHEGARSDLRSRGLCLVPVSCTEHVTNANGADLWSPSAGNTNHPSFSSNH